MRPEILNQYKPSTLNQIRLWVLHACLGEMVTDPARAAFYRPELFSKQYFKFQHQLMQGRSAWSIAERELFAANVASKVNCEFCKVSHAAFASGAKKKSGWASSMMEGKSQRKEDLKLKVVLDFLNKLTEQPWEMTKEDVLSLRQQGVTDKDIEEAAMICVLFSIGSRVSTAFDFRIPSQENLKRATPFILRFGYRAFS